MAKVSGRIELEESTWEQIDAQARRSGRTRNEVVDEAVRRAVGGNLIDGILDRVREKSDLTPERAAEIAAAETAAYRAERAQSQAAARRR